MPFATSTTAAVPINSSTHHTGGSILALLYLLILLLLPFSAIRSAAALPVDSTQAARAANTIKSEGHGVSVTTKLPNSDLPSPISNLADREMSHNEVANRSIVKRHVHLPHHFTNNTTDDGSKVVRIFVKDGTVTRLGYIDDEGAGTDGVDLKGQQKSVSRVPFLCVVM